MIDLYTEVGGEQVLLRKVASVGIDLSDWSAAWPMVAAWFYQMEATQFASEGRGAWKSLAASTVRSRVRKGYGGQHPILEQTGKLVASLLGAAGHVRRETPTTIELGTSVEVNGWNLGMLHQKGTKRMPARPVIGRETKAGKVVLYQDDLTGLRRIFAQHVHNIYMKGLA